VQPQRAPIVLLRVAVFEDGNADAFRQPQERGLGLRVRVDGPGGWPQTLIPDPSGVVTATLSEAGVYVVYLIERPAGWGATTRTALEVQVETDGSVTVLPGGKKTLPLGVAEGVAFAFGLMPQRLTLWPFGLLLGGLLLLLGQVGGRMRIPQAIRERAAIEARLWTLEGQE